MKKVVALIVGCLMIAAVATGCSGYNDERGKGDAPVENKAGDDAPAAVVNFPDTFANIAFKCLNGNGLYVTTREAPPVVIKDDPNCDGSKIKNFN